MLTALKKKIIYNILKKNNYPDDVVCHHLCDSHIEAEATDPLSTLRKVESTKAASYAHVLDGARSAAAVTSGLRVIVYNTCSFTSLGALGKGTVRCLNAAAGYLKKRAVAAARAAPRADGLTPQRLSGMFGSAFVASFRLPSCVAMGRLPLRSASEASLPSRSASEAPPLRCRAVRVYWCVN